MMGNWTPTRRHTLLWLTAALAAGCHNETESPSDSPSKLKPTEVLDPAEPVSGHSYGYDPDRLDPTVPWPRTMSAQQLALTECLAALIIPGDEHGPSAAELGAQHYVDEWVSAPYPEQQKDRVDIIRLLNAIEADCRHRFDSSAVEVPDERLMAIMDTFAWSDRVQPDKEIDARAFSRLRRIVIGVYATSEEGMRDLGYVGNRPMVGPYPGPTDEARNHLAAALKIRGLELG